MDIDFTRLRHVLAIAHAGSFSRAALDLNITQPALSRSVRLLEDRFGIRIFDRGRKGAVPTAVGRQLLEQAEAVVRSARNLDLNIRKLAGGHAGIIAAGMGPMVASMVLSELTRHVLEHLPGLQLHTEIRSPDRLVDHLLDGRIEMIIGSSWMINSGADVSITTLGMVEMHYMARSGHPLTACPSIAPENLRAYPIASSSVAEVENFAPRAGALVCDNFHIIRELLLESDLIWRSCPALAARQIEANRITVLEVEGLRPLQSEISLITRRSRSLSPAAQHVVDKVSDLLRR